MELRHNNTVLIDRFIINVESVVDQTVGPTIINGVFGLASVNISTYVYCRPNPLSCGQYCEIDYCTECELGYTGSSCSQFISYCEYFNCNISNMRCVDQVLDATCVCLPGFTGPDCQIDVNECLEGRELCNSEGRCVNEFGSFHCECDDGYTGQFCESRIEGFIVEVTLHSFENPGGRCADVGGTCANGSGCCDSKRCLVTGCDYMFLFCLRPLGTHISYMRSENRGNCDFMETGSKRTTTADKFASSIYGIKNPIKYTSVLSVMILL